MKQYINVIKLWKHLKTNDVMHLKSIILKRSNEYINPRWFTTIKLNLNIMYHNIKWDVLKKKHRLPFSLVLEGQRDHALWPTDPKINKSHPHDMVTNLIKLE